MAEMGRPSIYSTELVDHVCEQIACGMSFRSICHAEDMPAMSTLFKWLREHDYFSEQYAKAKQEACTAMAEEILSIADDGTNDYLEMVDKETGEVNGYRQNGEFINRSRLRVDSRKWLLSKMMPKKYGDKIAQELSGPNGGPIGVRDLTGFTDEELEKIANGELEP